MFKRLSLALFLVVIIVLAGCASKPVEKGSLRIGSLPRIFDLIAYVAQQEGLFEKQGIVVEIVPFRSTVEMNSALLAGELDGIIQDVFGAVNLNKEREPVKLVGWSVMPRMFEVVASPGSNITYVADLKHREVAVGIGTIMDYALDRLLMAEGLDDEDIIKVNVPSMPLRLEILSQGKVAAAILTPPLSDLAVLNGGRIIVDDTRQPFAGPGLVFSTDALRDKSEAIDRCIQAWQQAVGLINTEPEKYHSLLTEVARVPEAVSRRMEVPTFPKLRLPTEAEVDSVVSWMIGKELVSKPITFAEVVDTTHLR